MKLHRIGSGGQTGVDRAALDVALALGLPSGGWCPRGRRAEDGIIPDRYPLRETVEPERESDCGAERGRSAREPAAGDTGGVSVFRGAAASMTPERTGVLDKPAALLESQQGGLWRSATLNVVDRSSPRCLGPGDGQTCSWRVVRPGSVRLVRCCH